MHALGLTCQRDTTSHGGSEDPAQVGETEDRPPPFPSCRIRLDFPGRPYRLLLRLPDMMPMGASVVGFYFSRFQMPEVQDPGSSRFGLWEGPPFQPLAVPSGGLSSPLFLGGGVGREQDH